MAGVTRPGIEEDPAIAFAQRVFGFLLDRPPHQQQQRHDRDLQDQHQPDEGPSIHSARSYTRFPAAARARGWPPAGAGLSVLVAPRCQRRAGDVIERGATWLDFRALSTL